MYHHVRIYFFISTFYVLFLSLCRISSFLSNRNLWSDIYLWHFLHGLSGAKNIFLEKEPYMLSVDGSDWIPNFHVCK